MTLAQAMEQQRQNPKKKIIREGNKQGIVDVWFTVADGTLILNQYVLYASGHRLHKSTASFQSSPHNDWILID